MNRLYLSLAGSLARVASVGALSIASSACGGGSMPPPPAPPPLEPTPSAMPAASSTPSSSSSSPAPASSSAAEPPKLATRAIALPGSPGAVMMDILAFDPVAKRVWVPAGNTGRVDVIDTESGKLTEVTGWKTVERDWRGQKRLVGPSSVAIGEGAAYVANRADNKVCIVDGATLKIGACVALTSAPDCLQYVKATKELWVTTPGDSTMTILDVATRGALKVKVTVKLDGEPEGTAVDEARGIFYTNIENKDRTLAIDLKSRKVVSTWKPECGEAGPRGLVFDAQKRWLIVACTTRVLIMDVAADGKILSRLDTGAGVDMFDYAPAQRLVFVAAAKAATLSIAHIDDAGVLSMVATAATSPGTRVVVIDDRARAYVADSANGRLLVVDPPR